MTELRTIGEALWGRHWPASMAHALGCSKRACQRWGNGQNEAPAAVLDQLRDMLAERRAEIDLILKGE